MKTLNDITNEVRAMATALDALLYELRVTLQDGDVHADQDKEDINALRQILGVAQIRATKMGALLPLSRPVINTGQPVADEEWIRADEFFGNGEHEEIMRESLGVKVIAGSLWKWVGSLCHIVSERKTLCGFYIPDSTEPSEIDYSLPICKCPECEYLESGAYPINPEINDILEAMKRVVAKGEEPSGIWVGGDTAKALGVEPGYYDFSK